MRLSALFLFALLLGGQSAHASSLILLSDGSGSSVAKVLAQELEKAGAGFTPSDDEDDVVSNKVSSLECEKVNNAIVCSFLRVGETQRQTIKSPEALFEALREVDDNQELNLGTCSDKGACKLLASSVQCTVSPEMPDSAKGKYGCGLIVN